MCFRVERLCLAVCLSWSSSPRPTRSHRLLPTSLCSGNDITSFTHRMLTFLSACLCVSSSPCVSLCQEFFVQSQRDGSPVVVSWCWTLPPAGQHGHHIAALPAGHRHRPAAHGQSAALAPSAVLVRVTLRYIVLCCCRECRCWVGWWSLTVLQPSVFFPSSDAKTTAAPSACGWSREIWVRRSHDLTGPRPGSSVSMTCVCWCPQCSPTRATGWWSCFRPERRACGVTVRCSETMWLCRTRSWEAPEASLHPEAISAEENAGFRPLRVQTLMSDIRTPPDPRVVLRKWHQFRSFFLFI